MKPYFRDEKYSEGVLNAYQKLAAYAYHAAGVTPGADVSETLEESSTNEEDEPSILMNVFIFFLAIVGMILLGILNQALGPGGGSSNGDYGGGYSGGSSGDSSSRGGYGGGSSGGGGASDGW